MSAYIDTEMRSFRFTMGVKPIPRPVYNAYARTVRMSTDYADHDVSGVAGLANAAASSIRRIVIKERMISTHSALMSDGLAIAAKYKAGDTVEALSAEFGYTPLMIIKVSLIATIGQRATTDLFAGRAVELSPRDRREWLRACALDMEAPLVQKRIALEAADAEAAFVARFDALGVRMRTQADLVEEQVAEYGQPVCTPDILFVDKVWINGQRVHWIDFKNYTATPVRFLLDGNRAQADKYRARFGPGALAYAGGVVGGVTTSALMLDASADIVSARGA